MGKKKFRPGAAVLAGLREQKKNQKVGAVWPGKEEEVGGGRLGFG